MKSNLPYRVCGRCLMALVCLTHSETSLIRCTRCSTVALLYPKPHTRERAHTPITRTLFIRCTELLQLPFDITAGMCFVCQAVDVAIRQGMRTPEGVRKIHTKYGVTPAQCIDGITDETLPSFAVFVKKGLKETPL